MSQVCILRAVKLDSLFLIPFMHLRAVFSHKYCSSHQGECSKHFNNEDLANIKPE